MGAWQRAGRRVCCTSTVKITVKTCSICAMNLLPAVSLSGSSGSWRASMIENAMIKNSDSCENHLREANQLVGQARSSAFGRAELWRTICGRPRARTSSNREATPPTPSFRRPRQRLLLPEPKKAQHGPVRLEAPQRRPQGPAPARRARRWAVKKPRAPRAWGAAKARVDGARGWGTRVSYLSRLRPRCHSG